MNTVQNQIIPDSWEKLLKELFVDSWDTKIKRHRSPFVYRGLSNSTWKMPSSLIRLGGDFKSLEKHLLRNFRKYAHRDVVTRDSFWHWLTVAQHHGLPTRLVDWTWSPFIALHFATDDLEKMDEDGIVWCVNIPEVNKKLPEYLGNELSKEGSNLFTVEMLSNFTLPDQFWSIYSQYTSIFDTPKIETKNYIKSLEDFDQLSNEPFALFFEPPSIDDRIVNQYALFSVISDPTMHTDDWLIQYPDLYKTIIVPSSLKWEVRDKLDQANITERVLFPGLDGLSKWLKRHYSPKK